MKNVESKATYIDMLVQNRQKEEEAWIAKQLVKKVFKCFKNADLTEYYSQLADVVLKGPDEETACLPILKMHVQEQNLVIRRGNSEVLREPIQILLYRVFRGGPLMDLNAAKSSGKTTGNCVTVDEMNRVCCNPFHFEVKQANPETDAETGQVLGVQPENDQ